jgi:hypothetical protein
MWPSHHTLRHAQRASSQAHFHSDEALAFAGGKLYVFLSFSQQNQLFAKSSSKQ